MYINFDFYLERSKKFLKNPEMKKFFQDLKDPKNKETPGKKSSDE
jgi:hypothetical protein